MFKLSVIFNLIDYLASNDVKDIVSYKQFFDLISMKSITIFNVFSNKV